MMDRSARWMFLAVFSLLASTAHGGESKGASSYSKLFAEQLFKGTPLAAQIRRSVKSREDFPDDEIPALEPIRFAPVKFRLVKTIFELQDDLFEMRVETVCVRDGQAPVFDFREGPIGYIPDSVSAACSTTIDGEEKEVSMGGSVALVRDELFASQVEDFKGFTANFRSGADSIGEPKSPGERDESDDPWDGTEPSPISSYTYAYANGFTRELESRSFGLVVVPDLAIQLISDPISSDPPEFDDPFNSYPGDKNATSLRRDATVIFESLHMYAEINDGLR